MTGSAGPEDLAQLFDKINDAVGAAAPTKRAAAALVTTAVEQLPLAEHAAISVGRTGSEFRTIASTSEVACAVDAIQYEVGSGPCVDALVGAPLMRSDDLSDDARWPVFGPRAVRETGIISMLSHRLFIEFDPDTVAALNFYSSHRKAFTDADESNALILAAHGAAVVARATAQDKAENLAIALRNSREIGIAMGILMHRHKLTRDQAFDVLRAHSQHSHRKLADIATEMADTGALPPLPRHSGAGTGTGAGLS